MITETAAVVLVCNDEFWLSYSLESSRDMFGRYVIYDVGSTDETPNILDWFIETQKRKSEFFVRTLPLCPPSVQGTFRNSMIAEGDREYYFILDGDEVYNTDKLQLVQSHLKRQMYNKFYGVIKRQEVTRDMKQKYPLKNHHRLYNRKVFWEHTHPGERSVIKASSKTEAYNFDIICYHFHNTKRSSQSHIVPKRMERLNRATYKPEGQVYPFDLLKEVPLLQKPVNHFPVNPDLEKLQHAYKM